VPDLVIKYLTELPIVFLVLFTLKRRDWQLAPGWIFVALFVVWSVISGILSGDGVYQSLLYFRMLVYAYIVFWAVWNADLIGVEVLQLNKLILLLWVLQIAAALFQITIAGERVEAYVGTLTSDSGHPATAFPLFAMSYVMAFYCYQKRSPWLLLLALAFSIVGFASGKRAIYFLIPLVYSIIILWYCFREKTFASLIRMFAPLLLLVLVLPLLTLGLTHSKKFEYLQGRDTIEIINEATDLSYSYNYGERAGQTTGRISSSLNVIQSLSNSETRMFYFGSGPASLTDVTEKQAQWFYRIEYGIVGWSKDIISVGFPGMIFFISFYILLWHRLSRCRTEILNDYVKALHFGTHLAFFVFFLMYFFYCNAFVLAGWFTYVHLYFLALVLSPRHQFIFKQASVQ
jgi:hypothetical protein